MCMIIRTFMPLQLQGVPQLVSQVTPFTHADESVIFRISANCSFVKRIPSSPVSYQKRSHRFNFLNWLAIKQANVGPTIPPFTGSSETPPLNRSMSETSLYKLTQLVNRSCRDAKSTLVFCFYLVAIAYRSCTCSR